MGSQNLNKSPIWIWKCLHRVHWSMGSVWFYFTLSRIEIFVFTWIFFIFICVTATDSHTGQRWATTEGGRNIVYLHMFFRGQRGLHFLRQSRAFVSKPPLLMCVGQFSMVLACVVQADCLSVNTSGPLWALLLQIIGKGVHQPNRHQHRTRRMIFFFFCFNAWVSSWWYVTLLSVCLSDWRKMWGSNI